jgi:hypothetical protein
MKANHAGRLGEALGLLLLPFCLAAQQKYARVIGNAAYTAQTPRYTWRGMGRRHAGSAL